MPTYEYKCNKCEELFEIFQRITASPLKECSVCGGELRRLISGGAGIIFKGSGFYSTDNRSTPESTLASKENQERSEKKDTSSKDTSSKDTAKKNESTTSGKKTDSKVK
ncbi:MAG TPA: zinc ribbon domain-containing protein [Spirochaetes bacterium]|nr:zinc ribbon domain-containing protein [Spirochaetota bacterium]